MHGDSSHSRLLPFECRRFEFPRASFITLGRLSGRSFNSSRPLPNHIASRSVRSNCASSHLASHTRIVASLRLLDRACETEIPFRSQVYFRKSGDTATPYSIYLSTRPTSLDALIGAGSFWSNCVEFQFTLVSARTSSARRCREAPKSMGSIDDGSLAPGRDS